MKRLLIIRLSAIGDVAMTIPVIYACAYTYPQLRISVLSNVSLRPLFSRMPSNVVFIGADLKGVHRGLRGISRLYRELQGMDFDAVADFHNVLRTIILRFYFSLSGVRTVSINKGRREKKRLTTSFRKRFVPLKTSFERYADVLRQLDLPVNLTFQSLFDSKGGDLRLVNQPVTLTGEKGTDKWIGIAPFAAHKGKVYPLSLMEQVIKTLSHRSDYKLFLFGAGTAEREILEQWAKQYPSTCSLAGKLPMDKELIVMSHLDVMLSMDSANMHLASLVHTPVISVWGATHPYAGFMGWGQPMENVIQINGLSCRPCSIYGNKPCRHKDYLCLTTINPTTIVERINLLIEETYCL